MRVKHNEAYNKNTLLKKEHKKREEERRKTQKSRSEEKVVCFSSIPIPRKEMGGSHPG